MAVIRAVVFDIYKTLIDIRTDEESRRIYEFLSRWLSYHGVKTDAAALRLRYLELCGEEVSRHEARFPEIEIGKVFSRILDAEAPYFDQEAKARELALLFRILTTKSIRIYPGAIDLLQKLKGMVRLGIVSNAQSLFTIPELTKFGLVPFFDAIVLSSDLGVRKPNPEIFRHLLNAIDVKPEEVVFVGDSLFDDISGAGAVGMKTVWICRETKDGAQAPSAATPDYVVHSGTYQELTDILLSLLSQ